MTLYGSADPKCSTTESQIYAHKHAQAHTEVRVLLSNVVHLNCKVYRHILCRQMSNLLCEQAMLPPGHGTGSKLKDEPNGRPSHTPDYHRHSTGEHETYSTNSALVFLGFWNRLTKACSAASWNAVWSNIFDLFSWNAPLPNVPCSGQAQVDTATAKGATDSCLCSSRVAC